MLIRTKVALLAAIVLGTASAAMAADSGENSLGGAVRPGSMDGVNPVDHPNNPAVQSAKPPMSAGQGIRTEGRATSESPQAGEKRKDPQDPGPPDDQK